MGEKLITIRVPGDAVGLKYVRKDADGYMQDMDVTFDMYEGVIAPNDVLDVRERVQSYAEDEEEMRNEKADT